MDTLNIRHALQREIPFLGSLLSLLPVWVWIALGWLLMTFILKPYINAVVKLYQPKFDIAAQMTPSILRRLIIESFRLSLIATSLIPTLMFVLTPKERRLRVWRKNEVVSYIWIFSSSFPSLSYYKRVRSWFETNVYLDKRTSFMYPEPLRKDGIYIQENLTQDLNVSHEEFIHNFLEKGKQPIVRVGFALKTMNPRNWMGKAKFVAWVIYGWLYTVVFLASGYFLFTHNINGLVTFFVGVIMFKLDRVILTRRILNKARLDAEFYREAVRLRIIQLHW